MQEQQQAMQAWQDALCADLQKALLQKQQQQQRKTVRFEAAVQAVGSSSDSPYVAEQEATK